MNVLRKFVDANNAPLSGRKVLFTPVKSPEISASWLSTADSYQFVTDESGEITASVVANKYRVEIGNPLPATHFYLEVSETGSAVISSSVAGVPQRVYGNLFNLIKDPTKVKKFTITPARNYPQYVDNTIVALCHTASVPTDQGAVDYVSLYPGVYQCDALGKVNTIFHISVPAEGTSLEWNLKDLLVVKPSKGTPVKLFEGDNSYVLTVSSSDARYKKKSETGGDVELADTASYVKGTNVDGAVESASTASYIEGFNVRGQVNSAQMADRAGYAVSLNDETGPLTITSDYTKWTANGPFVATAMTASNGFYGTASHATSASYAPKPTKVDSASLSDTASYVKASNVDGTVTSASYAISSSHAPKPDKVNSASLADSASYVKASNVDGTVTSASYALSASHSPIPDKVNSASLADSASYVKASNVDGTVTSASYALSASHAPKPDKVNSASLSDSASYVKGANVDGAVATATTATTAGSAGSANWATDAGTAKGLADGNGNTLNSDFTKWISNAPISATSITASGGFRGNLTGSASFADKSTSASYAPAPDKVNSASLSDTASYLVPNNNYTVNSITLGTGVTLSDYDLAGGQLEVPGLYVGAANLNINDKATIWSTGQAEFTGITSSLHGTASWANSASHAPKPDKVNSASIADSASYVKGANVDGTVNKAQTSDKADYAVGLNDETMPLTITSDYNKWTANGPFVATSFTASGGLMGTASWAQSASQAVTASYLVPTNTYKVNQLDIGSVSLVDEGGDSGLLGVPGIMVGAQGIEMSGITMVPDLGIFTGKIEADHITGSLKGTATSASVLSTARSIALSGYAVGTATNFNGSANISIPVTSLKAEGITEPAYVLSSVTPTFRPNVDVVRADRTAFLPAEQIIIEQSIDTGTTWTDAGVSDMDKRKLFMGDRPTISLPTSASKRSSKCMLRITFTGMKYDMSAASGETDKYNYWNSTYVLDGERYSIIDSGWLWVNSIGDRIYYTLEAAKGNDPNTWTKMGEGYAHGGDGMGSFKCTSATFGGGKTQVTNYWNWRFTFRTAAPDLTFDDGKIGTTLPSVGQRIHHIKMFGDRVFNYSNRLMYNDHIYKWDVDQNVTFPAQVSASRTVSPVVTLTDGANIATPCEQGSHFRVTLGGNRTLSNPSNAVDGQRLIYQIKQDATGGRTLSFGANFKFSTTIPSITLSTGAGKIDIIEVLCDTVNNAYYVIGFNKGF